MFDGLQILKNHTQVVDCSIIFVIEICFTCMTDVIWIYQAYISGFRYPRCSKKLLSISIVDLWFVNFHGLRRSTLPLVPSKSFYATVIYNVSYFSHLYRLKLESYKLSYNKWYISEERVVRIHNQQCERFLWMKMMCPNTALGYIPYSCTKALIPLREALILFRLRLRTVIIL